MDNSKGMVISHEIKISDCHSELIIEEAKKLLRKASVESLEQHDIDIPINIDDIEVYSMSSGLYTNIKIIYEDDYGYCAKTFKQEERY